MDGGFEFRIGFCNELLAFIGGYLTVFGVQGSVL